MRIRFLGTRGEIERRSRLHRLHSSLLVTYRCRSLLIDYGLDWLGRRIDFEPVIARLEIEAFPAEHSLRAPAVGYRIAAGSARIFYAPDVVSIRDGRQVLAGIDLDVGDGASIRRSILRRRDGALIGHASIRAQLDWCRLAGVAWAIFTHCGSQIVAGAARVIQTDVAAVGGERGVRAEIAYDGMEVAVP